MRGGEHRAKVDPKNLTRMNKFSILPDECDKYNEVYKTEIPENVQVDETKKTNELPNLVNFSYLNPEPLLTVKLKINDQHIHALIDTGSSRNLIKKSTVEKLNLKIQKPCIKIIGLGGKEYETLGTISTPLQIYCFDISETKFEVVADSVIRNSVILGREFCKINCLSIDLSNRRISKSFNSANVDIYLDDQHNLEACVQEGFGVYAMADVNLKKGYHKVPVKLDDDAMKIPSLNLGNLYFESQCQNKKIEGLDGVLESAAINKNILIRIKPDENLTTYRIRKGEKLGSIYTIVEFDETDEKESE